MYMLLVLLLCSITWKSAHTNKEIPLGRTMSSTGLQINLDRSNIFIVSFEYKHGL